MAEENSWTYLAFHYDGDLTTLSTSVTSVRPFTELEDANKGLFKIGEESPDKPLHVLVTKATVFHPQGGGQPSDEGEMVSEDGSVKFTVQAVRTDVVTNGQVLHLGSFGDAQATPFAPNSTVTQNLDVEKRQLYSRLHTAGHVLGSAVRHLLASQIPNFDELKASHFPASAACEFQGSIMGDQKAPIQEKVDAYVDADMPVEIEWWTAQDFKDNDMEKLTPDAGFLAPGEDKFRVVRIRGAEVYPCGGTHVHGTKGCGKTTVKKISRAKGVSRVSYTVEGAS